MIIMGMGRFVSILRIIKPQMIIKLIIILLIGSSVKKALGSPFCLRNSKLAESDITEICINDVKIIYSPHMSHEQVLPFLMLAFINRLSKDV
jgi:hypothetical protein